MKFLVVGAGIFGATFARIMTDEGYDVKVIDKKDRVAGHIYDSLYDDFFIHEYGAHIFHTKYEHVWEFVNQFTTFNNYINSPMANYYGNYYNLPFNMNTFNQLLGATTPEEAKRKIKEDTPELDRAPKNLEEQAMQMVGETIYKTLIKDYTEKQWERDCKDLPHWIIKRLPLRFTYDNNYFNDPHQGIPINGYTNMVEEILEGIPVELNTEYNHDMAKDYDKVIYTGPIDQFHDYELGRLEYRTLRFEHEYLDVENYQGNAVVNYTGHDVPYTRILEHKHFAKNSESPRTVITKEYSAEWQPGDEPYYPVNDDKNNELFKKYQELPSENVVFAGRLGNYSYYNMDQSINNAMKLAERMRQSED